VRRWRSQNEGEMKGGQGEGWEGEGGEKERAKVKIRRGGERKRVKERHGGKRMRMRVVRRAERRKDHGEVEAYFFFPLKKRGLFFVISESGS
jgi:hypothetical protein